MLRGLQGAPTTTLRAVDLSTCLALGAVLVAAAALAVSVHSARSAKASAMAAARSADADELANARETERDAHAKVESEARQEERRVIWAALTAPKGQWVVLMNDGTHSAQDVTISVPRKDTPRNEHGVVFKRFSSFEFGHAESIEVPEFRPGPDGYEVEPMTPLLLVSWEGHPRPVAVRINSR